MITKQEIIKNFLLVRDGVMQTDERQEGETIQVLFRFSFLSRRIYLDWGN